MSLLRSLQLVFQEFVVADVAVKVARSALEAAKDVGQGQQQQ
jgi:hypothetical protein